MAKLFSRALLTALSLAMTGVAVIYLRLHHQNDISPTQIKIDLAGMVPEQIGDWRQIPEANLVQPPDDLKGKEAAAYAVTLARTYIRGDGKEIMLSIAYGSNQLNDRVQAHRPEYCYQAQGFRLLGSMDGQIDTASGRLPVRRLLTERPGRREPLTYWMTIGKSAILPGMDRKLAQLKAGLIGEVPDGMLVRVSTTDNAVQPDYEIHDDFIRAFSTSVRDKTRYGFSKLTKEL